MKSIPHFLLTTLLLGAAVQILAEQTVPLSVAVADKELSVEAMGNGRDALTLTLRNASSTPLKILLPAGLIAAGADSAQRVIVLRSATVALPPLGAVEVALPVAALSATNLEQRQKFTMTNTAEPRLAALLETIASQPDAPRGTSQLAVLGLVEDITGAQWRLFLNLPSDAALSPAQVTQAIDALGLLRLVQPERTFALASDADLKARALRNPWCRAKAMTIYGLDFGDGAAPPDLRQLLHTQLGDNCPICRQRALMQKPADIP